MFVHEQESFFLKKTHHSRVQGLAHQYIEEPLPDGWNAVQMKQAAECVRGLLAVR